MLIEIPIIKQNINDFETIMNNADGLVDEVKKLEDIQSELNSKQEELVVLAKKFYEL